MSAKINTITSRAVHGYNRPLRSSYYILGPGPWCDEIYFCCFICVTQWWALHAVIKWQFFTFYIGSWWHSYSQCLSTYKLYNTFIGEWDMGERSYPSILNFIKSGISCHSDPPMANIYLCIKFDTNIFIGDRYMAKNPNSRGPLPPS